MNSVHEQCTVTKNWVGCTLRTPRTQVARTLRAQCPCRGRCCAHSKLVTRAASAGRAHAGCALVATRPSSLPRPGRDIAPRSQPPEQPSQVATSIPCRDLPSAQLKPPRSRPQNGVATPTSMGQPEPCRDIKSVSRHHSGQSRSRPQIHVATPFPPNQNK